MFAEYGATCFYLDIDGIVGLLARIMYVRVHPQWLQVWRKANELKDRGLMCGGRRIVP